MPNASEPTPFLKWAGGKAQLLKVLVRHLPPKFSTYFEPFLGGGALFFKMHFLGLIGKAFLSDANRDLINCYIAIRDNGDALLTELELLQQHSDDKSFFYEVARPKFNRVHLKTGLEGDSSKAALLIYLNKTCYNGLYRVNSDGYFNVPWGRYNKPRLYDESNIKDVGRILRDRRISILCLDYIHSLAQARKGDFIYLDPPYQPISTTSSFTSYTPNSFDETDQRRLASSFKDLDQRGCLLLMSNSMDPFIGQLYQNYIDRSDATKVMAPRQISCKSQRRRVQEYLIFNYHANKG